MTGNVIASAPMQDATAVLDAIFAELPSPQPANDIRADQPQAGEDQTVLNSASAATNGDKFKQLWAGQWAGNYPSQSEADQALMNIICFYSGNYEQCVRLFRQSGLGQREKASRDDYVSGLIRRASDRNVPTVDMADLRRNLDAKWEAIRPAATPIPAVAVTGQWPILRINEGEWFASKLSPRTIVYHLIYADVGIVIAPGGTGKTTWLLLMLIHIVLGIPIAGREIVSPGRVAFISGEDSRGVLIARLRKLVESLLPPGMPPEERDAKIAAVRDGIIIIDVSANAPRLTKIDRDMVCVDHAAVDTLAASLSAIAPVALVIDPAMSFGVGESRVNDAEQGLIAAGRRLVAALNCAVIYVHHTGKANAREATEDQYSGRGGSAFADGSRMVFVLNGLEQGEWTKQTGKLLNDGGNGLKLNIAKLSYCAKQSPIYFERNGFLMSPVDIGANPENVAAEQKAKIAERSIMDFLSLEIASNIYYSKAKIENATEQLKLSRNAIRFNVIRLIEKGEIIEETLSGSYNRLIPTGERLL